MSVNRIILLALVFLNTTNTVFGKTIVNGSNYEVAFTSEEKRFIIEGIVDLNGSTIRLKKDCTLTFSKEGKFVNGQIVGDNTKLRSLRTGALGVVLSGTWELPRIDDTVFDQTILTDNQILDNISILQSDQINNTIILRKPKYLAELSEEHKQALTLRSNTVLKNYSDIEIVGNGLITYSVIKIVEVSNVRVSGGSITGDVGSHKYKDGTTSEWGFGISISVANDVLIDGIIITRCIGDGIYIGGGKARSIGDYTNACKNIVLQNVVSKGNRRQGVSITNADGVIIKNCVLANTGMYELTSPGCGLDIEPNEGQSVRNVNVLNCEFYKNGNIMDASVGGYKVEGDKCNIEKIFFKSCIFEGKFSIRSGSVIMKRCTMETLSLHLAKMPKEKVLLERCIIRGGSGVVIRSTGRTTDEEFAPEYRFKSCSIEMSEAMTPALFSNINHKGNEVAGFVLENCSLVFPEVSQRFDMMQAKSSCSFQFSKCQIDAKEHELDVNNRMYNRCRIK